MTDAAIILVSILRNAWGALVGMLVALVLLGMLYQTLKAVGGAMAGYPQPVANAFGGIVGLLFIGLYAFVALPQIAEAGVAALADSQICGPVAELGHAAALVIGAVASLRMVRAVYVAVVSSIVGGGGAMSQAVIEAAEALIGMTLVSVAGPVASAFFMGGAC
jgi:hypothetical protein